MARILSSHTTCINLAGFYVMAWLDATKEVRTIKELNPLKQALRELAWVGEKEHEGSLIDLAVLISKIVRTYEHKGICYNLTKIRTRTYCRTRQTQ